MKSLTRLLRIRSADRPVLAFVGPVFGLVTATTVVTISFSKALFLAHNPPEHLPWMFISAAVFTMVLSLGYVSLIGRAEAGGRLQGLLGFAALSYVVLGALSESDPQRFSLLIFAWCTGVGQLMMIQTWTWTSSTLPTRQARRLFPMFSALATVGATVGGLLTKALINDIGLIGLLALSVVLVVAALVVVRLTHGRTIGSSDSEDATLTSESTAVPEPSKRGFGRIALAVAALRQTPLLAQIAAVVFLVQAASVVLDFQFTAAIQDRFAQQEAEMAGFIGIYYAVSNGMTFVVAFLVGGKLTRALGIGLSASSTAIVLALGGTLSAMMGLVGVGSVFWGIAATSFGERVANFAVAKQALQAAAMPVDQRLAEPARFLIDGVLSRLAVVLVSIVFLFAGGALKDYEVLSPVLVVAAALAVLIGRGLGPAYRRALLSALADQRLAARGRLPDWARTEAARIVQSLLRTTDAEEISRGLMVAKELDIPLAEGDSARLLRSGNEEVVTATLGVLGAQSAIPDEAVLRDLLATHQPAPVICATLRLIPSGDPSVAARVQELASHDEDTVSAHAVKWLRGSQVNTRGRARLGERVDAFTADAVGPSTRQLAAVMTADGGAGAGDVLSAKFVHLVDRIPALMRSDSDDMRRLALEMLVELALPEHVSMLFDALHDPRLRALALMALTRMPSEVVLDRLWDGLMGDESSSTTNRVRLLQLAERIGGEATASLIAGQLDHRSLAVRNQAVKSLWRLTASPDYPGLGDDELTDRIQREVDRMVNYAVLDGALSTRRGERQGFLRAEIALQRVSGETRLFRLLGMRFARQPIERARANYRSADRRVRSNAIELLDTTVNVPQLRVVVNYIEGSAFQSVSTQTTGAGLMAIPAFTRAMQAMAGDDAEGGPIDALLAETDDWLLELYRWARAADTQQAAIEAGELSAEEAMVAKTAQDDVMEKLFLLRGVDLFAQVPADQLLPLAEVAKRQTFEQGTTIFEADDPGQELYVVVEGEVIIERDGQQVAVFGPRAAFGEMAILDNSPRSASARVDKETECLLVGHDDFGELLDIAPGLARGVMRVLTTRLRNTLDRMNQEG